MIFHVLFLTLALGICRSILTFQSCIAVHAGWWPSQANMHGCLQMIVLFVVQFITAAALFYLAELVEEYTVLTAKVIKGMLVVSKSAFAFFVYVKYLS